MIRTFTLVIMSFALVHCSPHSGVSSDVGPASQVFGGRVVSQSDRLMRYMVNTEAPLEDGKNSQRCSGVLISPFIVITAAHCLAKDPKTMKVYFNLTDLDRNPTPANTRQVERASFPECHTAYQLRRRGPNNCDIAVLKIDRPAPAFTRHFELANEDLNHIELPRVSVAGWGVEGMNKVTQKLTGNYKLKTAEVPVTESTAAGVMVLDQTTGTGTCMGDSGGPLFTEVGGRLILHAIQSSLVEREAEKLCEHRAFGVKIQFWREWIIRESFLLQQQLM